jgi:hypothetical protein
MQFPFLVIICMGHAINCTCIDESGQYECENDPSMAIVDTFQYPTNDEDDIVSESPAEEIPLTYTFKEFDF